MCCNKLKTAAFIQAILFCRDWNKMSIAFSVYMLGWTFAIEK
jgi:hypothetical protein